MACVLVFDSGILFPVTKQLSNTTMSYVASVGVGASASIPPNEINTLTAQIAEHQKVLDARESALREREIAAREYEESLTTDYSTYIISAILFILIVLQVLNYAMDFMRVRKFIYAKVG